MVTTGNNAGTGSHGRFWLQGEPEDKAISGRLFLQPGAHPLLDLDGALTPLIRETSRRKLPDGGEARTSALVPPLELISQSLTVHGTLDETGEPVTVPSAFTVGGGPQRQRLQAFYALLGGHVDGADAQFTRIRVRLCHLDAWAALPGFTLTSDVATGKYALAFEKPEVPPAPLANGARVSIEQVTGWNGPTVCGGQLERQLWLNVLDMPPVPYRDIDRTIVKPLMNLLALTVSTQCAVVAEMVAIGPDRPWLTVHHAGMTAAAEEIIPPPRILLPLTAIGMEGVAAWLDSTVRLGPLPSVVARVASSPDDTVEAQLIELTTVTEGLHRLLLPERKRMTDAQADEARSKALGALKNSRAGSNPTFMTATPHSGDRKAGPVRTSPPSSHSRASRRRRSRPRGQQRGRGPSRQHAPRVLRR